MKTKKQWFFSAILALLMVGAMPSTGMAQQTATATAQGSFLQGFGNDITGANVNGWVEGGVNATGTKSANGTAQVVGAGAGQVKTPGSNAASSAAATSVMSGVNGNGNQGVTANISGLANQASWAMTPASNSNQWAAAGNSTSGGFKGTAAKQGALTATGGGGAIGNSNAWSKDTNTTAVSVANTQGGSSGTMKGATGSAAANGIGKISAGTQIGSPSSSSGNFGAADGVGNGSYNVVGGPTAASGNLAVSGKNVVIMTGTKVGVTANVSACAQAATTGGCAH